MICQSYKEFVGVGLILVFLLLNGCGSKPEVKEKSAPIFKKVDYENLQIQQKRESAYRPGTIMQYKPQQQELNFEFEISNGFRVVESKGADYFIVQCIEKSLQKQQYKTNFSITFYPAQENMTQHNFYQNKMASINKLKENILIDSGAGRILEQESLFLLFSYKEIYPPYSVPKDGVRYIDVKEKIDFFIYKKKIYKLRYAAKKDEYAIKFIHYKNFLESLKFREEKNE
jgi:hypothetical protein